MGVRTWLVGQGLGVDFFSRSNNPSVRQTARNKAQAIGLVPSRRTVIKLGGPEGKFVASSRISLKPGLAGLQEAYAALAAYREIIDQFSPTRHDYPYRDQLAIWNFIAKRYESELSSREGIAALLIASRTNKTGRRQIIDRALQVAPDLLQAEIDFLVEKYIGVVGTGIWQVARLRPNQINACKVLGAQKRYIEDSLKQAGQTSA